MRMESIVDGQKVTYYSGRLIVGFPKAFTKDLARRVIESYEDCRMDSFHKPNVCDARVPGDRTLEYYEAFKASSLFRFVSLDLVERRASH